MQNVSKYNSINKFALAPHILLQKEDLKKRQPDPPLPKKMLRDWHLNKIGA